MPSNDFHVAAGERGWRSRSRSAPRSRPPYPPTTVPNPNRSIDAVAVIARRGPPEALGYPLASATIRDVRNLGAIETTSFVRDEPRDWSARSRTARLSAATVAPSGERAGCAQGEITLRASRVVGFLERAKSEIGRRECARLGRQPRWRSVVTQAEGEPASGIWGRARGAEGWGSIRGGTRLVK